jgi:hypothetical protein
MPLNRQKVERVLTKIIGDQPETIALILSELKKPNPPPPRVVCDCGRGNRSIKTKVCRYCLAERYTIEERANMSFPESISFKESKILDSYRSIKQIYKRYGVPHP